MKALATITIEANAHHDMKQAEKILAQAIDDARMKINNGTKIKRSFTNADDPKEIMGLFGQLKWWTLGKPAPKARLVEKKKGWGLTDLLRDGVREFGKQAKSIYEDEIDV